MSCACLMSDQTQWLNNKNVVLCDHLWKFFWVIIIYGTVGCWYAQRFHCWTIMCVTFIPYFYQNKKNVIIQNHTASEWLKRQLISTPDFLCVPYSNAVNWYMQSSPIDLITSRVPRFNLLFHFNLNALHFAFGFIDTISHVDVITWKHFPHYLPFVRGTHL